MQRRDKIKQSTKGRGTRRPKARKAPIERSPTADLQKQVADLARELKEAREHQIATGEILASLAESMPDAQPVFHAIVRNLQRLLGTRLAIVTVLKDGMIHLAAAVQGEFEKLSPYFPRPLDENTGIGRAMMSKQVLQFTPVLGNPAAPPVTQQFARDLDFNSVIYAPMIQSDQVVGVIATARREPTPFDKEQVAVIKAFADQAVIAIENARLLNELRESLQQQTATADVLKVISRSTFDLQSVLDTLVQSAATLCDAQMVNIWRPGAEGFRLAASYAVSGKRREALKNKEYLESITIKPGRGTIGGRTLVEGRVIQVSDLQRDPEYQLKGVLSLGSYRTALGVPLLREGTPIGVLFLTRTRVEAFTPQQVALVETFADQAVIAIENVRLFSELREQSQEVVKLNQQLERRVADQVGEIERMSRLRRFLSPQVADLIIASGTEKQLESHRREITALYCDLRGFTGFSEISDPEDVMSLLRDYHAAIGEIIIKYNGTLEHYAGDGVMVIFNDPIPVLNPALQAVRMALDLRMAIGALIEKWRRLGHELGFGVGIAHGFATLGTIGFEGRFDYAAIGTVSNVASRLCDEAKPGQILISPRVLMAVEDAVSVEPVGEFKLKGISRPLAAYNVLSAVSPKI
jgi:class 3 adenylate cyclase/putative methionine-R-sulfoxide reductase with GAF domain